MSSRIGKVTGEALDIPLREPLATSRKLYDVMRYVVVRVEADGAVGFGEARESLQITGETRESILSVVDRLLGPAVQGLDPFDLDELHRAMNTACAANTAAKSAIDIAVHDVVGKILGQPVSRLLGGAPRAPVPSSKAISVGPTEAMIEQARRYVSQGFRTLKIKTGVDADAERAAIRGIRKAVGPDVALKLDANQGWSLGEAVRFLEAVAEDDILMVEQPLPAWDLQGAAELRRKVSIPVMLDESIHSPRDARRAIEIGAADYINIKLVKTGGLFPALALNAVAESAGVACQIGTLDTSIGSAAALHLAHARANIRFAEINGPTRMERDVATGFRVVDGTAIVDEGPGLGLAVDIQKAGCHPRAAKRE